MVKKCAIVGSRLSAKLGFEANCRAYPCLPKPVRPIFGMPAPMFKLGQFNALSRAAKTYVCLVVASGAMVLIHSSYYLVSHGVSSQWFVLAALTLLTGSFTVKVPSTPVTHLRFRNVCVRNGNSVRT